MAKIIRKVHWLHQLSQSGKEFCCKDFFLSLLLQRLGAANMPLRTQDTFRLSFSCPHFREGAHSTHFLVLLCQL